MSSLHLLDYAAMAVYFAILVWIGVRVAREEKDGDASESFLAADRDMNLVQSTSSTAATDLGGGFSIAMGGLGFTIGIAGSWLIAVSALSILMVSFLMVPKVKRWSDRVSGLTTGDMFEARFDRRTGTLAAIVVGIAWFTFVGGQIIAGGKLLQVTLDMDLTFAVVLAGGIILAYTALGGLKAVIYTDVFQMFVLMIGILFIAVPIGLWQVGTSKPHPRRQASSTGAQSPGCSSRTGSSPSSRSGSFPSRPCSASSRHAMKKPHDGPSF